MTDVCPICGGKLGTEIWMINPPIRGRKCKSCGRVEEIFSREEITRHPSNDYHGRNYPFKEVRI